MYWMACMTICYARDMIGAQRLNFALLYHMYKSVVTDRIMMGHL